ncbi:transformation/transcription domain-associated protein-like protein isoform X2 [Tanacetum coccineum]|uniref:Transformation/transcription domain-associated protein-like protein isoform X2 n=1 Tax=Tanacetum coccineum TaxID=301880 RepID=A0ABQ5BXE0_9ASTR
MTIIAASAEPDSIDPKDDYVTNVCRHFAIIFHLEILPPIPLSNLKELDPLIFLDALVEVLADENRLHAKAALNALNAFKETHDEIWLEYTVNCFLQGIKFGIPNSRSHLAVLYLISFDTPNEPVGRAFDKFVDQIPHWVWLSWIPQLLLSQRSEVPHCKLVMLKLPIVGLMGMLDMMVVLQPQPGTQSTGPVGSYDGSSSQGQEPERSTVAEGNVLGGNENPSSMSDDGQNSMRRNYAMGLVASASSAFDAAKDIMEALKSKHTNLASELESLLTEIGSRFVTLADERLLAVVNALLDRYAVNKHVEFVREYKQDFEPHLDPESTATFPATLSDLTETLKHWKNILQSNLEDRFPAVLKLEEESRVLHDFHVVEVEVPGQYFSDEEVAPDHTIKLDRVGADITIVRRHGSSYRRLTLIGSDGSQCHSIVQTSLTPNARSDERILQLFLHVQDIAEWKTYVAFKKQFVIQLPLSSFTSFMLQIGGRSPNKILFARNTGKIFQTDFYPGYDANGMIEFNEPVPFRLTRNLQAFFSYFGVEGLIVSSMSAVAQVLFPPRRPLRMPLAPVVGGGSMNPVEF